jgi:hypothetical protein
MKSYNRYTPIADQSHLSLSAQGESILLYAPLANKTKRLQEHIDTAISIIPVIHNNLLISPAKKYFIIHLIQLYADRTRQSSI